MIKKIISACLAGCLLLSVSGCGKKEDNKEQTSNATNVTVYTVGADSIDATASYTGEIVAAESTAVSAKVSGQATSVNVKEGDYVSAGTVLLSIDSTSYRLAYNQALASYNSAVSAKESALASKKSAEASYNSVTGGSTQQTLAQLEAALDSAQISYNNALDNYNKQKNLFDMGAISEVEFTSYQTALDNAKLNLDTATTNYNLTKNVVATESAESAAAGVDVAAASVNSAQSGIESAKAALDIAKNNLNNCSVTAPISGYISAKNINKGQMASQGSPLFTITNTASVDAKINVTESVIALIHPGTKASISVKSAGVENMEGNVSVVNPVKESSTGLYSVKISIPNADGVLKEGMLADITLVTESSSDTLTVPSNALLQENDSFYVYVANGNLAEKRTVEVGISSEEYTEILSGLQSGDRVIVNGKEYISEKNNEINIVTE